MSKQEEIKEKKKEKKRNPLINVLRTEWEHLGSQRKTFLLYVFLFLISGTVGLMAPLVVGQIFNYIQESITSPQEFKKLIFLIFFIIGN